ncbi:MAG: Uma2 family endonuclease [Myxococcales bacterium]|nr:Uma2 family endonuclease [Myxococcales bacterium]
MGLPAASVPEVRDDSPKDDAIIVLRGVQWSDYERLLLARGDHSGPRLAYLDAMVEMMSPSFDHERIKSWLSGLVQMWCLVKSVDIQAVGSWTQKDETQQVGAEPDECFIIGPERKERPDLAIEVVWTSGGLHKLEIYRRLGVREVWTWQRGSLHVHVLREGRFEEVEASEALLGIDLQLLLSLLDRPTLTQAQRELMRLLQGPAEE